MKKLLLAFVILTGTAGADTWRAGQTADSVKATMIRGDGTNQDRNYGANTGLFIGPIADVPNDSNLTGLFQPAVDGRQGGYTRDSGWLILTWSESALGTSETDGANDTLVFFFYAMKSLGVTWVEGDATDNPADVGDVDYNHIAHTATAWGTPGADNTTSDRDATAFDSMNLVGNYAADFVDTIRIPGNKVDAVVDDGLVMRVERFNTGGSFVARFYSDDHATAGNRPYFIFFESAPGGAGALHIGPTNLGPGSYGPNQ